MKITLAQIDVKSGRCEQNFETIKKAIEKAKLQQVDIIVFPEMCISGYLLSDKWLDDDFCLYVDSFTSKIKELSDGIGIIFGSLLYDGIPEIKSGRDGRKARYNAVFFAYQNKWVSKESNVLHGVYIKHLQPDYRLFEDSRYFLSGIEVAHRLQLDVKTLVSPFVFNKNGKTYRIALQVCEDLWSEDYCLDITSLYCEQHVDYIVNVSSSPFTLHKEKARDKRVSEHAKKAKGKMVPIIYVNVCGMQNTGKNVVVFDGGSGVYTNEGNPIYQLNNRFQEEIGVYDFEIATTQLIQENEYALLDALLFCIKSFDEQMFPFKPKWIVGLSGGIDSAINAALLVKALGANRVVTYNLATSYNSQTTKNNAINLAKQLGVELRNGSIEQLHEATIQTMKAYGYQDTYPSLVYENIQARLRGHLLSTFASVEGGVIINNGNKIEVALGYCTLYGDCIGALSPLGDITKEQCFTLAKQINALYNQEIISLSLIPEIKGDEIIWDMPPSAELKDAQLDPMKWFYHDALIGYLFSYPTGNICTFMQSYLDDSIMQTAVGKWVTYYGLQDPKTFIDDLEWVLKTISNAVYKRIQSPPICVVSRGAFGSDYRESQLGFIETSMYQQLKESILKKKKSL